MASQAHDLALALYRYYTYGEESDLIAGKAKSFPTVPVITGIAVLAAIVCLFVYMFRKKKRSR